MGQSIQEHFAILRQNGVNPATYSGKQSGGLELRSGGVSMSDADAFFKMLGVEMGRVVVNEETALGMSALFACIDLISKGLATPPMKIYKKAGKNRESASDHPINYPLCFRPNLHMSPHVFRRTVAIQREMYGNAIVQIISDPATNRPVEFKPLLAKDFVFIETTDRLLVQITKTGQILSEDEYLHYKDFSIDGRIGKSKIGLMNKILKRQMLAENYIEKYYENGTHLSGYLAVNAKLPGKDLDEIGETWDAKFSGQANSFKTPVVPMGTEYHTLNKSNVESQLMEFLSISPMQIYQTFLVPPHLVSDTTKSTSFGKGIEDLNIMFFNNVLQPNAQQFEEEINYKCFRRAEHGTYYVKLNFDSYLRTNFADRTEGLFKLIQAGVYSPNDAREKMEENGYTDGDTYMVNGNMMAVKNVKANMPGQSTTTP